MGSADSVMLSNWYGGSRIESITAANTSTSNPNDVRTLSAVGLEQLINAMAQMAPPAAGATQWGEQQRSQLMALGVWA